MGVGRTLVGAMGDECDLNTSYIMYEILKEQINSFPSSVTYIFSGYVVLPQETLKQTMQLTTSMCYKCAHNPKERGGGDSQEVILELGPTMSSALPQALFTKNWPLALAVPQFTVWVI